AHCVLASLALGEVGIHPDRSLLPVVRIENAARYMTPEPLAVLADEFLLELVGFAALDGGVGLGADLLPVLDAREPDRRRMPHQLVRPVGEEARELAVALDDLAVLQEHDADGGGVHDALLFEERRFQRVLCAMA